MGNPRCGNFLKTTQCWAHPTLALSGSSWYSRYWVLLRFNYAQFVSGFPPCELSEGLGLQKHTTMRAPHLSNQQGSFLLQVRYSSTFQFYKLLVVSNRRDVYLHLDCNGWFPLGLRQEGNRSPAPSINWRPDAESVLLRFSETLGFHFTATPLYPAAVTYSLNCAWWGYDILVQVYLFNVSSVCYTSCFLGSYLCEEESRCLIVFLWGRGYRFVCIGDLSPRTIFLTSIGCGCTVLLSMHARFVAFGQEKFPHTFMRVFA